MTNILKSTILARIMFGQESPAYQRLAGRLENPAELSMALDAMPSRREFVSTIDTLQVGAVLRRTFTQKDASQIGLEPKGALKAGLAIGQPTLADQELFWLAAGEALVQGAHKALDAEKEEAQKATAEKAAALSAWEQSKVEKKERAALRADRLTRARRAKTTLKRIARALKRLDPLNRAVSWAKAELLKAEFRNFAEVALTKAVNVKFATPQGWFSTSPWKLLGGDVLELSMLDARADHMTPHSAVDDGFPIGEACLVVVTMQGGEEKRLNELLWEQWNELLPKLVEETNASISSMRKRKGFTTKGRDWAELLRDFGCKQTHSQNGMLARARYIAPEIAVLIETTTKAEVAAFNRR